MQAPVLPQGMPGGPPPGGPPPGGGYQPASAAQKTMIAGMQAPVLPQGMPGGPPPGMGGPPPGMGGPPPGAPPPAQGGAVQKTVMLQASEGIVSVASSGGAVPAAAIDADGPAGASTAFWIVSMLIGIGVGVLAYVVMLQL
ncbi:MAG: hypothetical protein H6708_11615 [Kofleriaceae bacterium]|nr:hypothetical protein [Kofleriaceae bacterium]